MPEIPQILRDLLKRRGYEGPSLERYLKPQLSQIPPCEALPGVVAAAEVILKYVAAGRKIVVFGDYDCDGVCATAIVVKTLTALKADVAAFLPERLTEGYGMSEASVTRCLKENPAVSLIVTVDNGINSVQPVAELKEKGIAVVVTDHHLPGDALPAADALVDPKVDAPDDLQNLCGAGVAFLLARRLVDQAKCRGLYDGPNIGAPLLILAGLATVTDIMPLVTVNRALVAEALRRFRASAPVGLKELHARAARVGATELTSRDFSFLLGPRINAAGRLASGMQALELVLADDVEIARECARLVDLKNTERKNVELAMTEEAKRKVVAGAAAQVLDLPEGHPGVAGIVAARIMDSVRVPVCVVAGGHGSARAPEGLNIRDAFVACDAVLERYGGHAAAGGFSVRDGKIDLFREMLCAYCSALGVVPGKTEVPKHDLDIAVADVTLELADAIRLMEPFGEGNPEPIFRIRGVLLSDVHPLGTEGKHLALALYGSSLRGVWWNHGGEVERLRAHAAARYDLVFHIEASDYGERHAELRLLAVTMAEGEEMPA